MRMYFNDFSFPQFNRGSRLRYHDLGQRGDAFAPLRRAGKYGLHFRRCCLRHPGSTSKLPAMYVATGTALGAFGFLRLLVYLATSLLRQLPDLFSAWREVRRAARGDRERNDE